MKKINLRESLLELDRQTSFKYTLTDLYEACMLGEDDKKKLVQYVADRDIKGMSNMLSNAAGVMTENVADDLTEEEVKSMCGEDFKFDNEPQKLEETYWIDDPQIMSAVYNLQDEMEDKGWTSVDSKAVGGTYYSFYRKREEGAEKASWKAIKYGRDVTPEVIDVTYGQALGREPLDSIDGLRKELGKKLLPKRESISCDFKTGDMVFVKPAKKLGRVVSVKGDNVEVEVQGGNDPDRKDTYYKSDLELEDSVEEGWNPNMTDCPTCGDTSFDSKKGRCSKCGYRESLQEDWPYDDEEDSEYEYIARKSVQDSDGFQTEYTWYKSPDGLNVFVFGDSDLYTPEQGNFDHEEEDDNAAQEWFDSYVGFGDDFVDFDDLDEGIGAVLGDLAGRAVKDTWQGVKNFGKGLKGTAKDIKTTINTSDTVAKVKDGARALKGAKNVDDLKQNYYTRQQKRKDNRANKPGITKDTGDPQDWKFVVNGRRMKYDDFMKLPQKKRNDFMKKNQIRVFDVLGKEQEYSPELVEGYLLEGADGEVFYNFLDARGRWVEDMDDAEVHDDAQAIMAGKSNPQVVTVTKFINGSRGPDEVIWERESEKWYLSRYIGGAEYEPAEGGYYYETLTLDASLEFATKEEAMEELKNQVKEYDEGELVFMDDMEARFKFGKYIGDVEELHVEREPGVHTSGKQIYEELEDHEYARVDGRKLEVENKKTLNERDFNKVQKRIARVGEFDNGYVMHNDWRVISIDDSEELARQKSLENPDDTFYVQYDDIMNPSSDVKWRGGQRINEANDDPKSWPNDKVLTYKDALALAKSYYSQGGDGFYETADKSYFDYLTTEYGPQTVKQMRQSFGVFDSVAKDRMCEAIKYPNGQPVTDIDLDKALDYQYGTDRDKDNSTYTDAEKQRAVNYWIDKTDPSPDGKSYMEEAVAPDYSPKQTGKAYKVFRVKNGKLYPPMVANPGGADTPVGVWLTAEEGEFAGVSKTGRPQVKSIGSGTLSYRPGWHLGDIPRASQFDRTNKETGEKEFPKDFVWAVCDYVMDVDYQPESDEQGYMRMGKDGKPYRSDKYQHSLAGLPKLPKDGYYKYRTNPRPDTVPWVITGAIRVNKLLSDAEVNNILQSKGIEPIHRQGGDKTLAELGL